jgi:hypothetical protein
MEAYLIFFSPKKLIAPSEAFSIIGFEKPDLHTDPDSRKVRVRILKGYIRIRNQVTTNRILSYTSLK